MSIEDVVNPDDVGSHIASIAVAIHRAHHGCGSLPTAYYRGLIDGIMATELCALTAGLPRSMHDSLGEYLALREEYWVTVVHEARQFLHERGELPSLTGTVSQN